MRCDDPRMDSPQTVLAALAGFLLGGIVGDAAEPVIVFIGGGGSVGIALRAAWELRRATPDWGRATAHGAVWGAMTGALLLVADASVSG